MSAKVNNVMVGIFVLIALALLLAGLLAFGAKSYFVEKTTFETAIPGEVSGLSVGSPVQLRGVPVGKVTRITFAWNIYPTSTSGVIVVEFQVEGHLLPLPGGATWPILLKSATEKGMRAIVKSQGITGTSLLAVETVDPKDNPPPELDYVPNHYYIPSAPGQFTRILESLEKIMGRLQDLDVAGLGRSATNTLEAARSLASKLEHLDLQEAVTHASALLGELRGTRGKIDTTLDQLHETVQAMKLPTIAQRADGLLRDLQASNDKLQALLDELNEAPVEEAVSDLRQTLQTLNETIG
jgi:ABC-type transporter Mla subunit MlaD